MINNNYYYFSFYYFNFLIINFNTLSTRINELLTKIFIYISPYLNSITTSILINYVQFFKKKLLNLTFYFEQCI
jgi:hypothetical protein